MPFDTRLPGLGMHVRTACPLQRERHLPGVRDRTARLPLQVGSAAIPELRDKQVAQRACLRKTLSVSALFLPGLV